MSVVTLAEAKLHVRASGSDEDTSIQAKLNAAEIHACKWMGRLIYPDAGALSTARAAVPAQIAAAAAAYEAAVEAADALTTEVEIEVALNAAEMDYQSAQTTARMTHAGMVIDDLVRSAVLLIFGELFAERETPKYPQAAYDLLQPHKLYG